MNSYIDFLARYQRTYASKLQATKKYEVFKKNYIEMVTHNMGEAPYKLGINKFSDFSDEELEARHTGGLKLPKRLQAKEENSFEPIPLTDKKQLREKFNLKTAPTSVNWVTAGKVSAVLNQG